MFLNLDIKCVMVNDCKNIYVKIKTKWKFSNYKIQYCNSEKSDHSNLTKNYSKKVCFAYLEIELKNRSPQSS